MATHNQAAELSTCEECEGARDLPVFRGGFEVMRPCPVCFGAGQSNEPPLTEKERYRFVSGESLYERDY